MAAVGLGISERLKKILSNGRQGKKHKQSQRTGACKCRAWMRSVVEAMTNVKFGQRATQKQIEQEEKWDSTVWMWMPAGRLPGHVFKESTHLTVWIVGGRCSAATGPK